MARASAGIQLRAGVREEVERRPLVLGDRTQQRLRLLVAVEAVRQVVDRLQRGVDVREP